jgi:two-component system, NarL family, response regulator NreC
VKRKVRILLADDHDIVRKGLRYLLGRSPDLEIVGEALDGRQAVRLSEELKADIVIMDVGMPLLNGIDAAAQIAKRNPNASVIVLSMHSDEDYVLRALNAGVKAYLLKDTVEVDLDRAIDAVIKGRTFFSPAITDVILQDPVRQLQTRGLEDSSKLLTEREREILQLLAEGKSNKDVAAILNVSPLTVETHRSNLMQKLDLHSTAEIVLYAVRKKIIAVS